MPAWLAIPAALIVAITGTLYFADRNMKTADNFFRGFPAVWNVVVFYLLLLRPPAYACAATIAVLAVLTFVPIRFVHPFRVGRWRGVTVILLTLWAVLAGAAVRQGLAPEAWTTAALCLIALYFLGIGLVPPRRDPR
jgi:phosphatidylcholine synthase